MDIFRPFGPPIYKNNIEKNDIQKINTYLDEKLLNDVHKKNELDASNSLVGKVSEEIFIEKNFLENNSGAGEQDSNLIICALPMRCTHLRAAPAYYCHIKILYVYILK